MSFKKKPQNTQLINELSNLLYKEFIEYVKDPENYETRASNILEGRPLVEQPMTRQTTTRGMARNFQMPSDLSPEMRKYLESMQNRIYSLEEKLKTTNQEAENAKTKAVQSQQKAAQIAQQAKQVSVKKQELLSAKNTLGEIEDQLNELLTESGELNDEEISEAVEAIASALSNTLKKYQDSAFVLKDLTVDFKNVAKSNNPATIISQLPTLTNELRAAENKLSQNANTADETLKKLSAAAKKEQNKAANLNTTVDALAQEAEKLKQKVAQFEQSANVVANASNLPSTPATNNPAVAAKDAEIAKLTELVNKLQEKTTLLEQQVAKQEAKTEQLSSAANSNPDNTKIAAAANNSAAKLSQMEEKLRTTEAQLRIAEAKLAEAETAKTSLSGNLTKASNLAALQDKITGLEQQLNAAKATNNVQSVKNLEKSLAELERKESEEADKICAMQSSEESASTAAADVTSSKVLSSEQPAEPLEKDLKLPTTLESMNVTVMKPTLPSTILLVKATPVFASESSNVLPPPNVAASTTIESLPSAPNSRNVLLVKPENKSVVLVEQEEEKEEPMQSVDTSSSKPELPISGTENVEKQNVEEDINPVNQPNVIAPNEVAPNVAALNITSPNLSEISANTNVASQNKQNISTEENVQEEPENVNQSHFGSSSSESDNENESRFANVHDVNDLFKSDNESVKSDNDFDDLNFSEDESLNITPEEAKRRYESYNATKPSNQNLKNQNIRLKELAENIKNVANARKEERKNKQLTLAQKLKKGQQSLGLPPLLPPEQRRRPQPRIQEVTSEEETSESEDEPGETNRKRKPWGNNIFVPDFREVYSSNSDAENYQGPPLTRSRSVSERSKGKENQGTKALARSATLKLKTDPSANQTLKIIPKPRPTRTSMLREKAAAAKNK